MHTDMHPTFTTSLSNEGHVHRFVIGPASPNGWEVREEHDTEVIRAATYTDWHRVERARSVFSLRASLLREDGWVDA